MNMVERVARAIFKAEYGNEPFDRLDKLLVELTLEQARAAIQAMREPTEAMVTAGDNYSGYCATREGWAAMIDEALK